jgi:hypothetical protein
VERAHPNIVLFTVDSAKQFLLSKLSARAADDGVPLDEIEKRMFLFSEVSGKPDFEANKIFEEKYNSEAYESKVSKLLRKAYTHDQKSPDDTNEWKDALKALKHEDFYGLVMVDEAKIPRSQAALWAVALEILPLAIIELGVGILGCLIVFRPGLLGIYLPDWARWLAFPLFLWLFWYIGQIFGRMQSANTVKRSRPSGS